MLRSLLYVSLSNLNLPGEAAEIDRIVGIARARNAALGITGALLFTETRFAQVLEGASAAVGEVMALIERDPRHRDIHVVLDEEITARRFDRWSLAYSGSSLVLDRKLKPLFANPARATELGPALLDVILGLFDQEQKRGVSAI